MDPYATPSAAQELDPALQAADKLRFWKRMRWVARIMILPAAALGAMIIATGIREAFVVVYSSGIADPSSMTMIIYATFLPLAFALILALPGLILHIFSNIRIRFWRKQEMALTS